MQPTEVKTIGELKEIIQDMDDQMPIHFISLHSQNSIKFPRVTLGIHIQKTETGLGLTKILDFNPSDLDLKMNSQLKLK